MNAADRQGVGFAAGGAPRQVIVDTIQAAVSIAFPFESSSVAPRLGAITAIGDFHNYIGRYYILSLNGKF